MAKKNPTLEELIEAGFKRFTRDNFAPGAYAELEEYEGQPRLHLHIGTTEAQVELDASGNIITNQ